MKKSVFLVLALAIGFTAFMGCNGDTEIEYRDIEVEKEIVLPSHPGMGGKKIIIAHRGASGYLPEHTPAAYELAIQMGADYIEPDLQFTRDGHLVALHDDTLDRTTDVDTKFPGRAREDGKFYSEDFDLSEIKTLEPKLVGTARLFYPWYTPSMSDPFKIATFDEVLELAKDQSLKHGRTIGVYPEAKQADPDMEDAILATLAVHGMNRPDSPIIIQSFSDVTIGSMRAKQKEQGTVVPQILLGAAVMEGQIAKMGVIGATLKMLSLSEVREIADGVGVVINYPTYAITRSWIEQVHAAGLKVHGWTFDKQHAIDAQTEYRHYLDMGMDGVFSNYPDLALLARDQFNTAHPFMSASAGPQIAAHRGASGYLAEHTFAAYELAIKMGADIIEPDLMTTADNVLVAMHDTTLVATTNVETIFPGGKGTGSGNTVYSVDRFTLAEIKQLTARSRGSSGYAPRGAEYSYPGFTPSTPQEQWFMVPTFEELCDFLIAMRAKYGRQIGIYPELKQGDDWMAFELDRIMNLKGLNEDNSEVIVQSFNADTMREYKRILDVQGINYKNRPLVLLGAARMTDGVAEIYYTSYSCTMAQAAEFATIVAPSIGANVTAEWIAQAHAVGLKVHSWTYNQVNAIAAVDQYQMYLDRGMDAFFSNYPNLCRLARDRYLKYGK